ncbi:MAG: MgtC/SapB family protein [Patescibacteria group bacterium]
MEQNLWILLQLLIAAFLGSLLGIERAIAGKTAGLRTFALVSLGSALFIIISKIANESYLGVTVFDPSRVASQIIVGIGFLGAGLIIFKESKVMGLTTAAGLWVSAGIGMAVGFKLYTIAVFATLLTLFIFTVLWIFEIKLKKEIKELDF